MLDQLWEWARRGPGPVRPLSGLMPTRAPARKLRARLLNQNLPLRAALLSGLALTMLALLGAVWWLSRVPFAALPEAGLAAPDFAPAFAPATAFAPAPAAASAPPPARLPVFLDARRIGLLLGSPDGVGDGATGQAPPAPFPALRTPDAATVNDGGLSDEAATPAKAPAAAAPVTQRKNDDAQKRPMRPGVRAATHAAPVEASQDQAPERSKPERRSALGARRPVMPAPEPPKPSLWQSLTSWF